MPLKQTHTFATLPVSYATFNEVARKLKAADYGHAFVDEETIDMHGIALEREPPVSAPGDRQFLRDMAHQVKNHLPDNFGFILLAFPFNEKGRLVYLSTAERADAIALIKEFLLKAGASEDWLRHIT